MKTKIILCIYVACMLSISWITTNEVRAALPTEGGGSSQSSFIQGNTKAKCYNRLAGTVYQCVTVTADPGDVKDFKSGKCYIYAQQTTGQREYVWKEDDCKKDVYKNITSTTPVSATDPALDKCQGEGSTCGLIEKYVNKLIIFLSALIGVAAVFGLVYSGIEYSMAAGDANKVAAMKNRITKIVIGIFAYMLFYAFIEFLIPGGFIG